MNLSQGAVQFREKFPGDDADIGRQFCVSAHTIRAWKTGARRPNADKQMRIYEAGGPAPATWNSAPPEAKAPAVPVVAVGEATPEMTLREADAVLLLVRQLMAELPHATLSPQQRVALYERLTRMVADLGKLTGCAIVNERQIVMSPIYARLVGRIVAALVPWPDALSAVRAVLSPEGA